MYLFYNSLCQRMMDSKVNRGIIVFPGTLTAAANKVISVCAIIYLNIDLPYAYPLLLFLFVGDTSYKHKRK
jgi:hypothetical protein